MTGQKRDNFKTRYWKHEALIQYEPWKENQGNHSYVCLFITSPIIIWKHEIFIQDKCCLVYQDNNVNKRKHGIKERWSNKENSHTNQNTLLENPRPNNIMGAWTKCASRVNVICFNVAGIFCKNNIPPSIGQSVESKQ